MQYSMGGYSQIVPIRGRGGAAATAAAAVAAAAAAAAAAVATGILIREVGPRHKIRKLPRHVASRHVASGVPWSLYRSALFQVPLRLPLW